MNLLALRGDPPQGTQYDSSNDYFQYAEDLVRYIRVYFSNLGKIWRLFLYMCGWISFDSCRIQE